MKRLVRTLVVASLVVTLASSCKKKDPDEDLAHEAESTLPPEEQVTPAEKESPAGSLATPVAAIPGDAVVTGTAFETWFKKYHLDLNDPQMLDADPDGDGASNRDEFLADTDPADPNSRPGIHKVMRLKEYSEVRLPLVVESVEGGKARLRRLDGDGKVETVKAGDTLRGLPLKVEKIEEIHDIDKDGHPIDRSTVALEDADSKQRLTLVKDMPARTAGSFATLTSADGTATVKVKQGDIFKWPGDATASYKVIDLREDQIVLQQLENKKMWTVTRGPQ